ncbi:TPA: replication initiation protein, partial [Enterococcus faecium]
MPIDNSVTLSIQRLRHLASLGNESNKQIVDRYFSNQPEPLTINEQMELLQTGINLHSIYMVDENENEIITAPAIARWVINKHTLEVTARINPE